VCVGGKFSIQEALESDYPSSVVGILLDFDDLNIYKKTICESTIISRSNSILNVPNIPGHFEMCNNYDRFGLDFLKRMSM
jgi:hypothetical protein